MKTTYIGLDGNKKETDAFIKQPEWLEKIGNTYFERKVEKKQNNIIKKEEKQVKEEEKAVPTVEENTESVAESVGLTLDQLCDKYELKYNKKPVGKWAKDKNWLISKL